MLAISCSIASDQGTHPHPGSTGETWKNAASFQAKAQLTQSETSCPGDGVTHCRLGLPKSVSNQDNSHEHACRPV